MNDALKYLFDAIEFASNSSTVYANFKIFNVRFPGQSIKSALDEFATIERIVDLLFYRKHVMWERAEYENIEWCVNSLKDLRDMCDKESEKFHSVAHNDKNHFFAILLRTWGNYSDDAYKEIVKSDKSNKSLTKILKDFRKKTYPIIVTLLYALPKGNLSRDNGLGKLELGSKNSRLKIEQIVPKWSIG